MKGISGLTAIRRGIPDRKTTAHARAGTAGKIMEEGVMAAAEDKGYHNVLTQKNSFAKVELTVNGKAGGWKCQKLY